MCVFGEGNCVFIISSLQTKFGVKCLLKIQLTNGFYSQPSNKSSPVKAIKPMSIGLLSRIKHIKRLMIVNHLSFYSTGKHLNTENILTLINKSDSIYNNRFVIETENIQSKRECFSL